MTELTISHLVNNVNGAMGEEVRTGNNYAESIVEGVKELQVKLVDRQSSTPVRAR